MDLEKIFSNSTNTTFFLTFLALSGTTIITLLLTTSSDLDGTFNTGEKYMKNALISETSVNIIASITYFYLLQMINKGSLDSVTPVRYLDWVITTPLLLLSLALYSTYTHNKLNEDIDDININLIPIIPIIALNTLMLLSGYLGETGKIKKMTGLILGFIFLIALFYMVYEYYIKDHDSMLGVYIAFATVWALYGVAYMLKTERKNKMYNILDLISKGGFGILLWVALIDNDD